MGNSLKKGMVRVLIANVISLFFGLLTNFILPKFLSIDSYSAIKTYQLYVVYIGVMHFGYEDGMYLKYGGKKIEEIDKKSMKINLSTLRIFQIVMTIIMFAIALRIKDGVFLAFSLAILPTNLVAYFKLLFQAVGEFGKYGRIMNMASMILFIINMILVFFVQTDNYMIFLILYVLWEVTLWILLEVYLRNKLLHSEGRNMFSFREMKENIMVGFPLMLGNFSSVLLTSIDRWFVKRLMNAISFAHYSFAVSTESFINVALTPFTVTLYNYFCKKTNVNEIIKIRNCVMIFASIVISSAFGAKFIIENFIRDYLDASNVMFILFAAQICYVLIKGVYVNLYKAQKRQKEYFLKLLLVVVIGGGMNGIFYYFVQCKEAFAYATLFSAIIWLCFCLVDFPDYRFRSNELIYMCVVIVSFVFCGIVFSSIIGFLMYIIVALSSTYFLMRDEMFYLINMLCSSVLKLKYSNNRRNL